MKIKKTLCHSYIIAITLLAGMPIMTIANDSPRSNGTAWLEFGPAIINSCARIELHMYQGPASAGKTIVVLRQDSKFNGIRNWINENFEKKLNLSPQEPSYRAQFSANYLVLYASSTGGLDDRLLRIPLAGETLGPQQHERKLAEIKALFGEKP